MTPAGLPGQIIGNYIFKMSINYIFRLRNVTISINEACHSVSTVPIPSAQPLKPITNPDLWEYYSQELVRFTSLRRFSSITNTFAVWSHSKVHTSKEKGYADKTWCDYCHKPFSREHSTHSRHIERHHKDQMKNAEASVVCDVSTESTGQVNDVTTMCV